MQNQNSEVARLLSQITAEYESASRGFTGLAQGTSRHDFINAKMENMMILHGHLGDIVGNDEAMRLMIESLGD